MHLIELLDRGASLGPGRVAFTDPDGREVLTYAQTVDLTHRVAAALRQGGVGPGDPVGVLSPNTVRAFPYVLGGIRAGCPWVGINARSSAAELAAFLTRVGAAALFVHPDLAALAEDVARTVPSLRLVVPIGPPDDPWLAPAGTRLPLPPLDPEGTVALFATGGTTGAAKAVRLSHRSLQAMTLAMTAHLPEERPVNLVAAPLTHAAGALVFPVLLTGGTNVVHGGVDAGRILSSIPRHGVTRLFLPPTAIYGLLDHPDVATTDTSSLRYFIYGAAPMSTRKLEEAIGVFGPVMCQFYGQVELPMMCTFLSAADHAEALAAGGDRSRLGSCGRPTVVASVAIMDEEGNLLPRGSEGEIVVRSSLQMTEYVDAAAATAEIRRPGGWQATGDLGLIDDAGYVHLRDRRRDLIISGGFNVFPLEVEQVLWQHPAVLDCAVIGLPDDTWGERVTAVVELKPGATADEDELRTWCRGRLSGVKSPKTVIIAALPRSSVGKVLKRDLRDRYWAERDRRI